MLSATAGFDDSTLSHVCDIDVGDHPPVAQRARRLPLNILAKLYELLKGLLRAKLIVVSKSPWASPVVIVLKKNGKDIRLTVDYRVVNSLTKSMVYSMPLVEDMLENFHSIMWFCSLDCASGYWAVPMTTRARQISAFVTPIGHFEWLRMAQGLKNARMVYQRMMDNALYGFVKLGSAEASDSSIEVPDKLKAGQDSFVTHEVVDADHKPVIGRRSYIDDLCYGDSEYERLVETTRAFLRRFWHWRISLSLPKSSFGVKKAGFLSHEVSADGIRPELKDEKAMRQLSFPKTLKQMQSILGSMISYSKFIDGYAVMAAVLYELTDEQLMGGHDLDTARLAFQELKQRLLNAPVLKHPVPGKQFGVFVFANKWALNACICQEHDGVWHPVRFTGRVLKDAETRYTDSEREVLALLRALVLGERLLAGQRLLVFTRHSNLKWLFTSPSLTGRALQFATLLSPWDVEVRVVKKSEWRMAAVHAMSLMPADELDELAEAMMPKRAGASSHR